MDSPQPGNPVEKLPMALALNIFFKAEQLRGNMCLAVGPTNRTMVPKSSRGGSVVRVRVRPICTTGGDPIWVNRKRVSVEVCFPGGPETHMRFSHLLIIVFAHVCKWASNSIKTLFPATGIVAINACPGIGIKWSNWGRTLELP
uniref:Uncharacterized protein n=2 Tax=Nymphaea colorata TaxID=210225 RepID=A0A5K0XXE1_9MAGN